MSRTSLSVGTVSSWGGVVPNPHSDPFITDWRGLSALPTGWDDAGAPTLFNARGVYATLGTQQLIFHLSPAEIQHSTDPMTIMVALDIDTWSINLPGSVSAEKADTSGSIKASFSGTSHVQGLRFDSGTGTSINPETASTPPTPTGIAVLGVTYDGSGQVLVRWFGSDSNIYDDTASSGAAGDFTMNQLRVSTANQVGPNGIIYVARTGFWFTEALNDSDLNSQAVSWGW